MGDELQLDFEAHHHPEYGYTNPDFDLHAELRVVRQKQATGWSKSTTKLERGFLKYWRAFCTARGLKLWRDDFDANSGRDKEGYQREVDILAAFLLDVVKNIKARGHRPEALPQSSLNVVRGVRRIHTKRIPAITMVPVSAVLSVMRSITKEYIRKHTYKMLIPRRREPWRTHHLTQMYGVRKRIGFKLGYLTVSDTLFWRSVWGFLELEVQSGMRGSECLVQAIGDWHPSDHLSRASLIWCIGGEHVVSPTPEQLMALTEFDYAIIMPPPSKTDGFGVVWGDKPIYLPIRFAAPWCAALRLRDIELAYPRSGDERALVPMFCQDSGAPLTYSQAHYVLQRLKDFVLVKGEDKSLFTFHSYRVTLATQLGNSGASSSLIQALCRWQSRASLKIYNRLQPERALDLLDKATTAKVTSITAANLPCISSRHVLQAIQSW